jgi:hypothetical protein
MTVKSSMTKPDRKRKVRVNRDAAVVEYEVPEVVPEVIPDVAPEVVVPEPLEELSVDISEQLNKLMDESSCVGNDEDPISPINSPKRNPRKPSAPKPLINSEGLYLNPRTNRYVKVGTSAYNKLVKDGVILEN